MEWKAEAFSQNRGVINEAQPSLFTQLLREGRDYEFMRELLEAHFISLEATPHNLHKSACEERK